MDDENDILDWSNEDDEPIGYGNSGLAVPRSPGRSGQNDTEDIEDSVSLGDEDEEQDYEFQRVEEEAAAPEPQNDPIPLRPKTPVESATAPQKPPVQEAQKPEEPTPHKSREPPSKKKKEQASPTRPALLPPPRPIHALPAKPVALGLPYLPPSHPSIVEARSMTTTTTTRSRSESNPNSTQITSPDNITTGDKITAAAVVMAGSEEALPPGWEPRQPSSGEGVYYFNAHTGESTWKRPTLKIMTVTHVNEDAREREDRRRNVRAPSPPRRRRTDVDVNDASQRRARASLDGQVPASSRNGDLSYDDRHYRPGEAISIGDGHSYGASHSENGSRRADLYRGDPLPLPHTDSRVARPPSPLPPPVQLRGHGRALSPPPFASRDSLPLSSRPDQGPGGRYSSTDGDYRADRDVDPSQRRPYEQDFRQNSSQASYAPSSENGDRVPLARKGSTRGRNRGQDGPQPDSRHIPSQRIGSPPRRENLPAHERLLLPPTQHNTENRGVVANESSQSLGHRKKSRFEPSPTIPPPPPPRGSAMLMRDLTPTLTDDDPSLVPEEFLADPAPEKETNHTSPVDVAPLTGNVTSDSTQPSVEVTNAPKQESLVGPEATVSEDNKPPAQTETRSTGWRRAPLPSQTDQFRGASGSRSRTDSRRPSPPPLEAVTPSSQTQTEAASPIDRISAEPSENSIPAPHVEAGEVPMDVDQKVSEEPSSLPADNTDTSAVPVDGAGEGSVSGQMWRPSVASRPPGLPPRPQESYPERNSGRERENHPPAPRRNQSERNPGGGRRGRREPRRPNLSSTNSIPVSNRRGGGNGGPSSSHASQSDLAITRNKREREAPRGAVDQESSKVPYQPAKDPPERLSSRSPALQRQQLPTLTVPVRGNRIPRSPEVQMHIDPSDPALRIWTPRGEEPPPEFRQTVIDDARSVTPPPPSRAPSSHSPASQRGGGRTTRRFSDSSNDRRHLEPPPLPERFDGNASFEQDRSPRPASRSPIHPRSSPAYDGPRDAHLPPPHPDLPRRPSVDHGLSRPRDSRLDNTREARYVPPPPRTDSYVLDEKDRTYRPRYPPLPLQNERMVIDNSYVPSFSQNREPGPRADSGRNPSSLLDRISMDHSSLRERVEVPSKRGLEDIHGDDHHMDDARDPYSKRQRRRPNGKPRKPRRGAAP